MQRISDTKKCMASLAVFRNLFESHNDIYTVISKYAAQIIMVHGIHVRCDVSSIMNYMITDYGFEVPHSVLKNALTRLPFITLDKTTVLIDDSKIPSSSNYLADYELQKQKNDKILDKFIDYVEQTDGRKVSPDEKEEIISAFCTYIVDESINSKYSSYILTFIIDHQENQEFREQLKVIREGAISFVGLSYQTNDNSIDVLDEHLTIYLDTEILFHMAGYNGALFQKLFDEFYDLVQQANSKYRKKNGKNIISLKYLQETMDEVNGYFDTAERIVRHQNVIDMSRSAMNEITKGCTQAYQIRERQADFNRLLRGKGITKESYTPLYNIENYALVIEQEKYLSDDVDQDKVNSILQLLQNVRTRRGGRDQNRFRCIGYILLSGKQLMINIAQDAAIRQEREVPLATTLSFLTNRFWFSLNKGLGSMNLVSFDVIAKTQLALSVLINEKISESFDQIDKEVKNGQLDPETAKQRLAILQQRIVTPGYLEPQSGDNDGYLSFLNSKDFEAYIAQENLQKQQLATTVQEYRQQLNQSQRERDESERRVKKLIERKQKELNEQAELHFHQEMSEYEEAKRIVLLKEEKKYQAVCASLVIGYGLIVIMLFWINKTIGSLAVVYVIAEFISHTIPFVRSVVDHLPILNSATL